MKLINKKASKMQNVLITIYFFLAIFKPNFCSISTRTIMFFVNLLIIAFHLLCVKGQMQVSVSLLSTIISFVPFFLYYTIVQIIHYITNISTVSSDLYISLLYPIFMTFLQSFIGLIAIYILYCNIGVSEKNFYKNLFYAILVQLICVLLAFFVPSIKDFFLEIIIKYSESETISNAIRVFRRYRCYGFSSNLFDAFGYTTSILITIVFAVGVSKKQTSYVTFAMIMLIIPLLNARTGLVLCIVGFGVVLCYHFNIKTYLKYLVMAIFVVIIFAGIINRIGGSLKEWINIGIDETILFLTKGDTSSGLYGQLFGEDLVFPEDIWLGAGASPEDLGAYTGIDVGYIQCIWRFGILGTVILFFGYINMYRIVYKKCVGTLDKSIVVSTLLIFFIYLIKLYSIQNSSGNALIFGIPAIILAKHKTYVYHHSHVRTNFQKGTEGELCK